MRILLGQKKRINNSDWLHAASEIESLVSKRELDARIDQTLEDIRRTTQGKNVAYSWSGGKDSIVLSDICRKAGITSCMFTHTELEYPEFFKWCMDHLPDGAEVINTKQDLQWLSEHQNMLFPDQDGLLKWMVIKQRKAFTEYFFKHNLDMLIVGHRRKDGNIVGQNGVLQKQSGEVRYSPMAAWEHELILAYIHYYGLEIPMIYSWKDGFYRGTHSWPERSTGSIMKSWQEVFAIDSSIVVNASKYIDSARKFLDTIGGRHED